jgi:hypothetical protein
MRKLLLAVDFTLAILFAVGAARLSLAQGNAGVFNSRPTNATLTGVVQSNALSTPWILLKWGTASNDVAHVFI